MIIDMKNICYLAMPFVFLFGFFYGLFAGLTMGLQLALDRLAVTRASHKNFPGFYDQSSEVFECNDSIASQRAPLFFVDFLSTILVCFPLIIFLIIRGAVLGPMCLSRGYAKKVRSLSQMLYD